MPLFLSNMHTLEQITMDDCRFSKRVDRLGKLNIDVELPARIDVYGLKAETAFDFHDHDHYRNDYGDLFVTCSPRMGFAPTSLEPCYDFRFLSTYPTFNSNTTNLFTYSIDGRELLQSLREDGLLEANAREIIGKNELLNAHFNRFLDYVNEFGRLYGPEHLIPEKKVA